MRKSGSFIWKLCVLSLGVLLAHTACSEDFQGTWQGYIHLPQVARPYLFHITKEHEHWAANVILDDDWGNVWKAASIVVTARHLELAVPIFGAISTYDGSLSADGNALEGTWTAGVALPLRMLRATPATQWRETPHKTRFVSVQKGIKLEVLDWGGTGRPVVMLAGAGLTAHLFSQFAAKLTADYHVYGITRRGSGASSAVPLPKAVYAVVAPGIYELKPLKNNPYDADRLGDDVVQVLNTLHIERPVLVGHSIAGEELTSIASRYPHRVAGLIYLDAFAEFAFSDGHRYDALFTAEHPMRVRLPPGQTPQLSPDEALLLGMHEYRRFPAVPALAIFALPHHIPGLKGQALADFDANQQRAVDRMNRIRPLLPTVRIVQFPKADHMVWESNQTEVLREMKAFIAKLPS